MKKNMKAALGASLKAEEQAVKSRFDRADAVMEQKFETPAAPASRATAPATPVESVTKVIRDSFTMPAADYDLISELKKRALKSGYSVTKSEILRAGLLALNSMNEAELVQVIEELDKVKMGRPARKN